MKRVLLHLVFLALFFGCAPVAYIPIGVVQNVPLLNESSKTRISMNVGSGGFSPSFARVLNDRNIMMMNLSYINIGRCETCETNKRFLFEMALGRFKSKDEDQVFEWFVGGGFGSSNVRDSKFSFDLGGNPAGVHEKAKFIQPFVQFDYGEPDENNEIAYSIKMVAPYFFNYTHVKTPEYNETIIHYDNSWIIFLQPAFTKRWGFEHFKVQGQLGFSVPIIAREYAKFSIFASIGLSLNY